MKRLVMIAVAVVVLALGALAIGGAAADEDDGLVGSFLARVADKLGVTEDELKTAIDEAGTETIDEAVAEGRLTEEKAERIRERVEEGGLPLFMPRSRHHGHGHVMDAAAEVLDVAKDDLMEERQGGKSLAEVAEAQGMTAEQFKEALLTQVQTQLDELVAEGDLTQTQAADIFQRTEENIDDIVNGEGCLGGFGGMRRGPGGMGGPGGFGGPGFGPFGDKPEAEPSDVTA